MLAVEGLTVRAARRALVDRVSFEVEPGEVVAVVGPNGAGKTTLLEAIVGLRPSEGTVRVKGAPLFSFAQRASTFSFAPDEVTPPPEVLVSTLLDHAHAHRPRRKPVLARLREALNLAPLFSRSPGLLSRGERKRLALYVALAADRPIVVLDEPLGAFDPLQLRGVLELVRSIVQEGASILVTVHQMRDAERVADRVLLLAEGRNVAFGSLETLRERTGQSSLEDVFVTLLSGANRAS